MKKNNPYYRKRPTVPIIWTPWEIPEVDFPLRGGCYVEVEYSLAKVPSRAVIRIMRPTKGVESFPGFVAMFDGWYQHNIDGDDEYRARRIVSFVRAHSKKVSIVLRAPWDVVAALALPENETASRL